QALPLGINAAEEPAPDSWRRRFARSAPAVGVLRPCSIDQCFTCACGDGGIKPPPTLCRRAGAVMSKASEFSAEEKAAMKERARELKAEAKTGQKKADGEAEVLAKIAEM